MKRKPKRIINWFVLGLISLPILFIGTYFWATNSIASLENYRSPLSVSPPISGESLGTPITERVVLVILDALRYDTSTDSTIMPYLKGLRDRGASAKMLSQPPSFSAPGWVTLLTGAWPEINDSQLMNPPGLYSARPITQEDIFSAAEKQGLNTAVSGYIWFENMLSGSGIDASFYTIGEDNSADQEVVTNALQFLQGNYELVLIHIDQIDYAGHHEGGPRDIGWQEATARSDKLLQLMGDNLDFEKDTIILLSDHGQIDKGGHGGDDDICLTEPFIAVGKSIIPGQYPDIKMVDIAPTIAVLLGTNIPASNQGHPLLEMLEMPTEYRSRVSSLLIHQQNALLSSYTQAIGYSVKSNDGDDIVKSTQESIARARYGKLAKERIWRNLIAVFLTFVPGYILYLRKEQNIPWLILGSVFFLLGFNIQYYLIAKNTYSLNWIPGISDFIIYIGITTLIALIPAWVVVSFFLQGFHGGTKKLIGITHGMIWMIIYILVIPFLVYFALFGVELSWTLPNFTLQYLAFLSAVMILLVSAFGLTFIGLIALVGKIFTRNQVGITTR